MRSGSGWRRSRLAPADQLSRMLDDGRACLVLDGVERLPDGRDFVADLIDRLVSDTSDTILVVNEPDVLAVVRARRAC